MPTLERAISLACEGHSGQLDKGGRPYILHCLRVMQAQTTETGMIVGVLHDYLKDGKKGTPEDRTDKLLEAGFSQRVIHLIVILSRISHNETYTRYIERVSRFHEAIPIKIADLKDNMNMLRLSTFTDRDAQRLIKYITRH